MVGAVDSPGAAGGGLNMDSVERAGIPEGEPIDGPATSQGKKSVGLVVPGLQDDVRHGEHHIVFSGDGESESAATTSTAVAGGSSSSNSEGGSRGGRFNHPWSQADYTRIIIQALHTMGYNRSAAELEAESGLKLHSPAVSKLQTAVLDGNWDEVDAVLLTLQIAEANLGECLFAARRQKYLELLEARRTAEAIAYLQEQITPLKISSSVLHALTSLIVFKSADELRRQAQWEGPTPQGRQGVLDELRKHIPPSILLPPNRLATLVGQALKHQVEKCTRYNSAEPWSQLLVDCSADSQSVPEVALHILDQHQDEVWYVQFSHEGTQFATASKDKTVIIWQFNAEGIPEIKRTLRGHTDSVSFVSWGPGDEQLLSCGNDYVIKLWDVETGELVRNFQGHTEAVTAISWMPDGRQFVSGGYGKKIFLWRTDTSEPVSTWQGERVCDLALSVDGKSMVTISPDKKIKTYAMPSKTEISCVCENECVTSMCLADDGRHVLVNVSSDSRPEVHLWDLEEQAIVQRFRGHRQARYVIRSCFGGIRNSFVICGSEDSLVYVWHMSSGALIAKLGGHAGTINSVAWSNAFGGILASVSDDNTVRLWGCRKK